MNRLAARITEAWNRRGLLAWTLYPLSLLMRGVVTIRRTAYAQGWLRSHALGVPVIVVGNRIVGGAGKTPTAIALLRHLQASGWHPGVLSRGYKASGAATGFVMIDGTTAPGLTAAETGDEPLLIWRHTGAPVMVGRDRAAAGRALLAGHPGIDVLLCDDGLQHLRLRRDMEVIVFDERGTGNGWLLPAGPLREPIHAPQTPGLVCKPIVIYNAPRLSTPLAGHLAQRHLGQPVALDDWWQGRRNGEPPRPDAVDPAGCWAMAGIAQPKRFFDALRAQGWCFHELPLPDHADLSTPPWPPEASDVFVTEKDAVKLHPARVAQQRPGSRVWVAALDFHLDTPFWQAFDDALGRLQRRSPTTPQPGSPRWTPD